MSLVGAVSMGSGVMIGAGILLIVIGERIFLKNFRVKKGGAISV